MTLQRRLVNNIRVLSDGVIVYLSFITSVWVFQLDHIDYFGKYELTLIFLSILSWIYFAKIIGLYDEFKLKDFSFEVISVMKVTLLQGISVIVFLFVLKDDNSPRSFVLFYDVILFIYILSGKLFLRLIFNYLRRKGRNLRNILIIGAGEVGNQFADLINNNPHFGYNIIGFLDDQKSISLNGMYLGNISELEDVLNEQVIENVVIALPNYASDKLDNVIKISEKYTKKVKIIPDYFRFVSSKYSISMMGKFPIISVRNDKINEVHWRILKRIYDIILSSLLIIILSPILFIIAVLIKATSPGPVFFKQERWGRNNYKFKTLKFRSMTLNSKDVDSEGNYLQARKNDPRVTKVGRFIRMYNLDELPQLFNVLFGDMSLVGPRPHPTPLNLKSKESIKHYMVRHLVKPGISGWAQVNGLRGETTRSELMQKRIEHDIWYIENWSIFLDIQITLLTVWVTIKGDPNAY